MRKLLIPLLCLAVAAGLEAAKLKVQAEGDPNFDFAAVKTWAWDADAGEVILQVADDGSGRADGELLAGDLEDERPEGVERRQLVQPGPGAEVRARVNERRKDRIPVPQVLPGFGIGEGSGRP